MALLVVSSSTTSFIFNITIKIYFLVPVICAGYYFKQENKSKPLLDYTNNYTFTYYRIPNKYLPFYRSLSPK